jgi:hypothetical protein
MNFLRPFLLKQNCRRRRTGNLGRISAVAQQKLPLRMFCLRVPYFVVKTFRQLDIINLQTVV